MGESILMICLMSECKRGECHYDWFGGVNLVIYQGNMQEVKEAKNEKTIDVDKFTGEVIKNVVN